MSKYAKHISSGVATLELEKGRRKEKPVSRAQSSRCRKQRFVPVCLCVPFIICDSILLLINSGIYYFTVYTKIQLPHSRCVSQATNTLLILLIISFVLLTRFNSMFRTSEYLTMFLYFLYL